ncbi:MAG: putative domain containing protein [Candidatus Saccharibacteria bacterium]|nr:putative domain containing protein [Candidatus Saccharibacteria bacterium]
MCIVYKLYKEKAIRSLTRLTELPKDATNSAISLKTKLSRTVTVKRYRKRFIRYGLLVGNLAIVAVAAMLVLHNPSDKMPHSSAAVADSQATNPLDTLSAADIAVTAARMTNLVETTAVTNQADSVAADLNTHVVDYAVVPKPQILPSVTKTKADIKDYTVQNGDSLGDLATKFGVTSDSIKWSNGLTSATLTPGNVLAIPPIDGIVYTVKTGDTAETLASKYSANKDQITVFNDAEVTGLKANDRIVVPGGSIAPPPPVTTTYYGGNYGGGVVTAIYSGNGYDYGWCTWYVSNRRAEIGRPVPNNLGNAYSWYVIAQRAGLPTGGSPEVGAVAVNQGGNHVSVVEQVNDDGSFWISEMNASGQVSMTDSRGAGGWGRIDYRLVPSVGSLKFIY